jgi:hypothetical protein
MKTASMAHLAGRETPGAARAARESVMAPDPKNMKLRLGHHMEEFMLKEYAIQNGSKRDINIIYPGGLYMAVLDPSIYLPSPPPPIGGKLMASLDALNFDSIRNLHAAYPPEAVNTEDGYCMVPALSMNPHEGGHSTSIEPATMAAPKGAWCTYGPKTDAFMTFHCRVIECKVVDPKYFKGEPLEEHLWQVEAQMLATGTKKATLLYMVGTKLHIFDIDADPVKAQFILETIEYMDHLILHDRKYDPAEAPRLVGGSPSVSVPQTKGDIVEATLIDSILLLDGAKDEIDKQIDELKDDLKRTLRDQLPDGETKIECHPEDANGYASLAMVAPAPKPNLERALELAVGEDKAAYDAFVIAAGTITPKPYERLLVKPNATSPVEKEATKIKRTPKKKMPTTWGPVSSVPELSPEVRAKVKAEIFRQYQESSGSATADRWREIAKGVKGE